MSPSPGEELQALLAGAGLLQPAGKAFLRVRGADAADYLQRMTSQDLVGLEVGAARRTCVLDAEGRLLGAPWVWRDDDGFVLELSAAARDRVAARLERYVVADDVAIERAHGQVFLLAGPESPAASAAVADAGAIRVVPRDVGSVPGFAWCVLADGPEQKVVFAANSPHWVSVGVEAWTALRVLTRTPACGAELTAEILPLEARLEVEAVSFSKGCYPGQEPVTMALYRGRPPTLLVRARADGGAPGCALLRDGRPVGRVTTMTPLTASDEPNTLAFVKHAMAAEAPRLDVEGGGELQVLDGEGPG